MRDEELINLYEYLRRECQDIDQAKRWIYTWYNEWYQVLPWDVVAIYSMRSMAGHVSNVLEGYDTESGYCISKSYIETKYGTELYRACFRKP